MSLFSNKKPNRSAYQPTESARVNESTEVDLFVADNGTYWGLSRVNPNGGRSYRLLKPEQCRDAVEAVGFMAQVFAKDPNCAPDLKAELSALSARLETVVAEVKELAAPNGETRPSGLLAAFGG
ncbi:hypothetical protein [Botrimarina mediterranea]|uniref:Uncharacterized protein n=1 Tax=Botrimarina mediterranea TaxID=2528022 RepID=A0A518K9T7_9BACT|nr:hypothetical protein [Botrimarina mediterranea]QDV74549.1 hypothetical protein Spa11_27530 [Botrimarina mediterranea]QDV79189.1 hypothetical protein K2D_28000 [Planctomycetes bacterium K2D]